MMPLSDIVLGMKEYVLSGCITIACTVISGFIGTYFDALEIGGVCGFVIGLIISGSAVIFGFI